MQTPALVPLLWDVGPCGPVALVPKTSAELPPVSPVVYASCLQSYALVGTPIYSLTLQGPHVS